VGARPGALGRAASGEHVETFEQATLGLRVEVGCAIVACLRVGATLVAVRGTPSPGVVLDIAYRGEVAITGADVAAAGAGADAALASWRSSSG
jgi:hypothetical protein